MEGFPGGGNPIEQVQTPEVRERIHERVITPEGRDAFSSDAVSGDRNPIHFGEDAIAHGMHVIALVSGLVVAEFGEGTKVTSIAGVDMRGSIPVGEPFKVFFDEPVPTPGSRFNESDIGAIVTRTKIITDPNGGPGRQIDKKAMGAKFTVILPSPDFPTT